MNAETVVSEVESLLKQGLRDKAILVIVEWGLIRFEDGKRMKK